VEGVGSSKLLLARHYHELGRYESALDALQGVTSDELETDEYWLLRSECLRRLGRYDEAVAAARSGLGRTPDDIGLLDSLGLTLGAKEDWRGADDQFLAALALVPEHPVLLSHHAEALARQGRQLEAEKVVSQLQSLAPDSLVALEARAQIAYVGERSEAQAAVDELLAVDPENRRGHILRGNLAAREQRFKPAARAFQEAAALDPSNTSVVRAARRTRLAAHPLLTPSRLVVKLSRGKPLVFYYAVIVLLFALHQPALALAFWLAWLVFVAIVPRVLRARYRRRYGEL